MGEKVGAGKSLEREILISKEFGESEESIEIAARDWKFSQRSTSPSTRSIIDIIDYVKKKNNNNNKVPTT